MAVLASLRKVRSSWWRPIVEREDFTPSVGYEALAWGRHTFDHRDAWSLIRDVDHPSIGLILDSFHSLARDIPSASIGDIRVDKDLPFNEIPTGGKAA